MKNFPTIIPVVAVALIDGRGRVLMQKRKIGSEHGGLWEFPGGKVEYGESLEESLCREVMEELGIVIEPSALAPLSFASASDQRYVILLYTCHRWAGEAACLEGAAIEWFEVEAISGLSMPPLDIPLARALADLMKRAN